MKTNTPRKERDKRIPSETQLPVVFITGPVNTVMPYALQDKLQKSHEGVLFLGGWIIDRQTIITSIFHPDAKTTRGSYSVCSRSMSEVVNQACSMGLEIVGQLHTHPMEAYHSDGDVTGATLVRPGFVSIVVPDYGKNLPDLVQSCAYVWDTNAGFIEIPVSSINLVPHYADCRSRV